MELKPITRQEQIIAGKELEPITRMEKFLKQYGGGPGGGASSWNDLKDKPFGEETVTVNEPLNITWDGNTEGLVSADDLFYKVSDLVLTDEQIQSVTLEYDNGFHVSAVGNYQKLSDEISAVGNDLVVSFVKSDNAVANSTTFPRAGIYFMKFTGGYVASLTTTEPVPQTKTVVHKIDEKWLPSNIVYGDLGNKWLYKDVALTTYCTREEILALGMNFEVSIVDTETKVETGQFCKPLMVKDEGAGSEVIVYINYLDEYDSIRTSFMRTDGYSAPSS